MTQVFISGSRNIKNLSPLFISRINNILENGLEVLIGDSDGADASVQRYLSEQNAKNVTVFCTGDKPRNNLGDWPVNNVKSSQKPGTRAYFTAKDLEMARKADVGLMVWDAKSPGTLSNVVELLKQHRKSVVYINKLKQFAEIRDVDNLESLLSLMSDHALKKADEKIALNTTIKSLKNHQFSML